MIRNISHGRTPEPEGELMHDLLMLIERGYWSKADCEPLPPDIEDFFREATIPQLQSALIEVLQAIRERQGR